MTAATVYPAATFESKIGFDGVRRIIRGHCATTRGSALVDAMAMSTDADTVRRLLGETSEMMAARDAGLPMQLAELTDPAEWLMQGRVGGAFIEAEGLVLILGILTQAQELRKFFAVDNAQGDVADSPSATDAQAPYPLLRDIAAGLDDAPDVRRAISRILDRTGTVKDSASPELADIRRQLNQIGGRIASAMRRVLADSIREGLLEADTTPTVRDGRLVIPVPPMHKRRITGIVHDESASGKTVFIEPAAVVELNNHQRELELEERREVVRILTAVTAEIRPYTDAIATTYATLAQLDFISAKAVFARESRGEMPRIADTPQVDWFGARHPMLQASLERQGRTVVPLNITLSAPDNRILIVSGPNAGGKSVALKTVGVIQYMTQCGVLPTMHGNSTVGMMNSIFVDIGDQQSIEDDLSTYSSHLRNMRYFLEHGNDRTLLLIDEFGSGTEPRIGGAIAQSLLMRFNDAGMWGVITTHYQNLKTLASETKGLVNGSMLYDRQRMQPLFQLDIGHPGSSFAIEIARKTGLPAEVIDDARQIAGSDYVNLDKYLLDIARDKRYWSTKREQVRQRSKHLEQVIERYENDAETLRRGRREIIDDARRQAAEIIADSNAAIEKTIHDIRARQAEREATKEARRNLADRRQEAIDAQGTDQADNHPLLRKAPKAKKKKTQPDKPQVAAEQITAGMNVLLDGQGQPGSVMAVDGNKATVAFGALKMSVDIKRLTPTVRKAVAATQKASSFVSTQTAEAIRQRQLAFNNQIDLRGMRADEALQAVTYFIDDAVQFNATQVRILHGTGTGALRTVIRQYLETVPAVRAYHDEDVRFGGAGITVVEF